MTLWNQDDCAAWQAALNSYSAVVAAQNVRGLDDLDRWYRLELPAALRGRTPAYATPEELQQATSWKMKRGVWRERNRQLVAGNSQEDVEATTRAAFAAVPDPRRPVALISKLAGVGPATASALLSAHTPAVYPFFDELVANQIPDLGPVAFTAAYYARYSESLRGRAKELNEHCPNHEWTAQELSQALWAASGGKIALTSK